MKNSPQLHTTALVLTLAGSAHAQSLFRAPMPQPPIQAGREQQSQPQSQPNAPAAHGPSDASADRKAAPNGGTPSPVPAPAPPPASAPSSPPSQPQMMSAAAGPSAPTLDSIGLFVVQPTKPHGYQKHDKLDIIINEISNNKQEQSLDAKKDFNLEAELKQFPSMAALLTQSTLTNGIGAIKPAVGYGANRNFKGDGSYERKDRLTARIAAIVQDVKPNGLIFVEARETIQSDEEIKTMVLSGLCDPKDITNANTVQSSQLANLVIRVEHQGEVKKTATPSWLSKFFDDIFGP